MSDFVFKEIDREGEETLDAISKADKFNHWMFKTIEPWCKGEILEIGSGIGNISRQFINKGYALTLSDIRQNYCERLRHDFGPLAKDILLMDIVDPEFDRKHAALFGHFDTVFALNIVEHVKDDALAMENMKKLLKPGGHLIVLVPAYQALYNRFDKELEHFRRYTLKRLSTLFEKADFQIIHRQYFNLAAVAGWWFSGAVLRKKTIPEGQMSLYNKLVPAFKLLDKLVLNKAGISAIVVGKKKA